MAAAISEKSLLPDVGCLSAGTPDAGETLLFLHGWAASKELWWTAVQDLGDTARCIALDLPGTGGTPLPSGLRTMADFARWVHAAWLRLDLPPVILVGHSFGGNLAARIALDFPGMVRRLILVDAALEPAHFPARARWPLSPRYGLATLRLLRLAALPFARLGRRVPHGHGGSYWASYARRTHLYVVTNTDAALQVQLRALAGSTHDFRRLATLSMPVLIVHGGRDGIIPVARARALAGHLPHAQLHVFPDAQHVPMDTDPAGFADVLRDFCQASSS